MMLIKKKIFKCSPLLVLPIWAIIVACEPVDRDFRDSVEAYKEQQLSEGDEFRRYVYLAELERRWLGHDTNESGVRDDVEALLRGMELNAEEFSASMGYAALLQELMRSTTDGQTIRVAHYLGLSLNCMNEVLHQDYQEVQLEIERLQFNNELRLHRYQEQVEVMMNDPHAHGDSRSMERFCNTMKTRYQQYHKFG
ncbi:hypothetical protein [Aliagarivorans marinus]|uniref:hypothetical protein n=1 Tax=Aliagarivorans marinus TaxID=561965 RepID=UPI00040418AA|nr:hypothetical protein [Aliagarivorans marinus]